MQVTFGHMSPKQDCSCNFEVQRQKIFTSAHALFYVNNK